MIQSALGKWLLMEKDIKIREDDMEISDEDNKITSYIETWFDVDKRFGTSTYGTDDYINLYVVYDSSI